MTPFTGMKENGNAKRVIIAITVIAIGVLALLMAVNATMSKPLSITGGFNQPPLPTQGLSSSADTQVKYKTVEDLPKTGTSEISPRELVHELTKKQQGPLGAYQQEWVDQVLANTNPTTAYDLVKSLTTVFPEEQVLSAYNALLLVP